MAVHTFTPQNAENGELPFKCGDILEVYETEGTWRLASLNGQQGKIPFNYVKVIGTSSEDSGADRSRNSGPDATQADGTGRSSSYEANPNVSNTSTGADTHGSSSYGDDNDGIRVRGEDKPKSSFSRFREAMESYLDKLDKKAREKEAESSKAG
jgi:hypothetical protein